MFLFSKIQICSHLFRKRFLRRKSDHRKRRHSRHRLRRILADSATVKLERLFSAERKQKSARVTLFERDWLRHPVEKRESGSGKNKKKNKNLRTPKISSVPEKCPHLSVISAERASVFEDSQLSANITLTHPIFEASTQGLAPGLKYKGMYMLALIGLPTRNQLSSSLIINDA